MKKILLILAAAMFLTSCAASSRTNMLDQADIKGQTIYVGQSQAAVEKLLGAPDQSRSSADVTDVILQRATPLMYHWVYGAYRIGIKNGVVSYIYFDKQAVKRK